MTITIIKLYELLKSKLGEKGAEELTLYIQQQVRTEAGNQDSLLITKEELSLVRLELGKSKTKMIRWMFIFWVLQLSVTFTIFKYFFDN